MFHEQLHAVILRSHSFLKSKYTLSLDGAMQYMSVGAGCT